jgi:acetyl-CoA acetyltransferase
MSIRAHAQANPQAIMRKTMTLDDYLGSRFIIEPLRLFDCCLVTDGAACVLVTSAERARDLAQPPVYISGMQGIRGGRDEFVFGTPGLGINQQDTSVRTPRDVDLESYRMAGVERSDVDAFYTYDAFSPAVLFALERFGFCGQGEAADWVQHGRIGPGGELPVNTSGGLLSEAHVSGWNSIVELTRQLRGACGERQVPDAQVAQWGTVWGDSIIFRKTPGGA